MTVVPRRAGQADGNGSNTSGTRPAVKPLNRHAGFLRRRFRYIHLRRTFFGEWVAHGAPRSLRTQGVVMGPGRSLASLRSVWDCTFPRGGSSPPRIVPQLRFLNDDGSFAAPGSEPADAATPVVFGDGALTVRGGTFDVETFTFPGRWMPDGMLDELHEELCALGRECLGDIPGYGVYLRSRAAYANRIITVLRAPGERRVIGFSAMVLWHAALPGHRARAPVVHLGLVIVAPEYRGRKFMYALYHRPLVRFYVRRMLRPFWITSTTMEPVIVGSVADSFSNVHPHYLKPRAPAPSHVYPMIAQTFFREHGHEMGVWEGAVLDEDRFVIRGSSLGACRPLMVRYDDTAKYRIDACNEYCRRTLDYSQGDEVLQVGRFDFATILRSAWWLTATTRRRLRGQRRARAAS